MTNDHGQSPGKPVTRYGVVHAPVAVIGNEERFAWQKPEFGSDMIYELPETKSNRGISFGSSIRAGLTDDNPDTKKRSTGPGSYDSATGYPHLSDYPSRSANRFASAPRQSMAMKTASPGAVYDITRQYWNGPEKSMGIGFNRDSRLSLSSGLNSANAEMLWPKMSSGPAITMGARLEEKGGSTSSPGPIYDVHEKIDFRTGPSYSFGNGRSSRFGEDDSKPVHPPQMANDHGKSTGKHVTRYGVAHAPVAVIGNEERFAWQKPEFGSDVIYELPETKSNRGISFGSSTRAGLTDDNPDTKKRSTGPGSYDSATGYPHLSDYPSRSANRFASAPRQSMAMKTASPGAVYDITRQYWNGPEKSMGIGFNRDSRLSLGTGLNSENAEILWPKLPPGPSITMGARLKVKNLSGSSPGPIYDVHKKIDFKTGPAHSFGRGRNSRFGQISHLPDNGD